MPAEFVVQKSSNANPPALFLAIDSLLKNEKISEPFLKQIYPRLKVCFVQRVFNALRLVGA